MYLTKFVRKDGKPDEDYFYHTSAEAIDHLRLFLEDNSNLYTKIVASDEGKNAVLQILVFDEEGKAVSFKNGDVVRLHPDFCSEGECKYIYAITNINDHNMRCSISCLNSGMAIPGSELVGLNMIKQTGLTLKDLVEHTENM